MSITLIDTSYNAIHVRANDETYNRSSFQELIINAGTNSNQHEGNTVLNPSLNRLVDFITPLVKNKITSSNTGIMPPGVLALTPNYIVFERPPEYKNIFIIPRVVSEITNASEVISYRIPVPWQIYIVHYSNFTNEHGVRTYYPNSVRMHFMKTNLTSLDQEVYMATLPNFYGNGNLCRPMFSDMSDIDMYPPTIAGVIHAAYDWVWNSGTNLDLTESVAQFYIQFRNTENTVFEKKYGKYSPHNISSDAYFANFSLVESLFSAWEECSISDVLSYNWPLNSKKDFFRYDNVENTAQYMLSYLESINELPRYEMHWDEENEAEYQCNPEYDDDCECMHPVNDINHQDFYKFVKTKTFNLQTFGHSMQRFINDISLQDDNYSSIRLQAEYSNLVNSICL